MREYLILSRAERESAWMEQGVVEAHSPEQAIKKAIKDGTRGEVFVAVPTRNWAPVRPKVTEREPVIELESVDGQLTVEDVLEDAVKDGLVEPVEDQHSTRVA